jgi:uncharacterized protein YndB with AHSA1/START domain
LTRSFTVSATTSAPVDAVWALLADTTTWPGWAPMVRTVRYEREGDAARDAVGAIRFLGVGRFGGREEITALEPPHHFAYRMVSGLPVRGYAASVDLVADDHGGSTITWSARWERARPEWFWRRFLHMTVTRLARGLARRAEVEAWRDARR